MTTILQASMPRHQAAVHVLFEEYLCWVCTRIFEAYQVVFDPEEVLVHDMQTIEIFMPPKGLLLLAYEDKALAGCACMRTIGDQIAEIKRMYVRPAFRRKGIGRLLVSEIVQTARQSHCTLLRLDSAGFMSEAHALYRSFGFQERTPYEGSEIPPQYHQYWVFMELNLADNRV